MGVALKGVAYRNGVSSLVGGQGGGAYRGRSLKSIRSSLVEAPGGRGAWLQGAWLTEIGATHWWRFRRGGASRGGA